MIYLLASDHALSWSNHTCMDKWLHPNVLCEMWIRILVLDTLFRHTKFHVFCAQSLNSDMRRLNLTHWGRVTHICVGKLTIIGSDNGLSPERRQAIIWTNAGLLLIGPLGTNVSEISIEISTFSFKKMRLKVSSAKWRPFRLGLNVLMIPHLVCSHIINALEVRVWMNTYFAQKTITAINTSDPRYQ